MSLAGLKNLFFYQTFVPAVRRPKPHSTQTSSTDTAVTDVESQDSNTEKATQKRGFRVDARVISDATIGLSDGLTVPFALTAGLSALGNTKVVIYGGFAELIAGAISMGLGGYLGAKSEA
jgi:VIT1/CCC1 family predicted Fe2+/Mn2+ transporter